MHYLKNDISEFEFEVYKSSNICQKVVLKLQVVIVIKLSKFDTTVFGNLFYSNILCCHASARDG